MTSTFLSRRTFLIGCSAAAAPLFTPMTFAATPGDNRLVVIVLRGAMDGIDLMRPLGDPNYALLRPKLAQGAYRDPLDLDGFFALHPACAPLFPLWATGEMAFAAAVATPYRNRSHFIGQDMLENGSGEVNGILTPDRDGWLNRALQLMPNASSTTAVAVGVDPMMILEGKAPAQNWFPVAGSRLSAQGNDLLSDLYNQAPDYAATFAEAQVLRNDNIASEENDVDRAMGGYVADQLNAEARIATFSFSGWDTHQQQEFNVSKRFTAFSNMLLTLRERLGSNWKKTTVVAMTEFGRTAAENGSGGTDHGTGGMALLAGGALRGGRILGQWPGLAEASLLDRRDLMPTGDVRAFAATLLQEMFGLSLADVTGSVFPGLEIPAPLKLVL